MIHYSCDRCHCAIDDEASRVSVRIEVSHSKSLFPCVEDEVDHLAAMNEALQNELLTKQTDNDIDVRQDELFNESSEPIQFDLCQTCYRKFRRNPLGRDLPASVAFSNN